MELTNATTIIAGYTLGMDPDGRESVVVVIKGTFTLPTDGAEPPLAEEQAERLMAEQLPGLAGEESGGTLESLFIDEGFSHLDGETLDIVASALEVLGQDRSRLIGVITHVPALAERMPARIVVHKTQAGSSVSVE